eukprot:COSAG02_NODE_704_length_18279_cov_100.299560_8_plen_239_part_00
MLSMLTRARDCEGQDVNETRIMLQRLINQTSNSTVPTARHKGCLSGASQHAIPLRPVRDASCKPAALPTAVVDDARASVSGRITVVRAKARAAAVIDGAMTAGCVATHDGVGELAAQLLSKQLLRDGLRLRRVDHPGDLPLQSGLCFLVDLLPDQRLLAAQVPAERLIVDMASHSTVAERISGAVDVVWSGARTPNCGTGPPQCFQVDGIHVSAHLHVVLEAPVAREVLRRAENALRE